MEVGTVSLFLAPSLAATTILMPAPIPTPSMLAQPTLLLHLALPLGIVLVAVERVDTIKYVERHPTDHWYQLQEPLI
jgi:hypothetical protein